MTSSLVAATTRDEKTKSHEEHSLQRGPGQTDRVTPPSTRMLCPVI